MWLAGTGISIDIPSVNVFCQKSEDYVWGK